MWSDKDKKRIERVASNYGLAFLVGSDDSGILFSGNDPFDRQAIVGYLKVRDSSKPLDFYLVSEYPELVDELVELGFNLSSTPTRIQTRN